MSQAAGPPPVTVAQPVKRTITEWDEFTGRFEAIKEVQVRARVGGFVTSVEFTDGDMVHTGDLLYLIDSRPFEAVMTQARGQLADARANYQQVTGGNTGLYVFPICVLFVYLVLAAQYGSWTLPFAVILIVPMCLLAATLGVRVMGQDINILTQIGFVVLVGLAAKNAILIVEFARDIELEGRKRLDAVIDACRLRLRPIPMTSFAFILGVLPLVVSGGSGSEMRQAVGVAVFFGMLGVTLFGLIFTPVFYFVVRNLADGAQLRKKKEILTS